MTLLFPLKKLHIWESQIHESLFYEVRILLALCLPSQDISLLFRPLCKTEQVNRIYSSKTTSYYLCWPCLGSFWMVLCMSGFHVGCSFFLEYKPPLNPVDVTSGTGVSVLLPHDDVCISILCMSLVPGMQFSHQGIDSSHGITNSSPSAAGTQPVPISQGVQSCVMSLFPVHPRFHSISSLTCAVLEGACPLAQWWQHT